LKSLPASDPLPNSAGSPPHSGRRLARNTAALSISQVARVAFNALLSVLIARQLGAEGLGKWAVIIAYWNIFQVLMTGGAPRLVIRGIARDPAATASWFQRTLLNQLLSGVGAAGLLLAIAYLLGHPPQTSQALAVVALALLPAALVSALESVLQGREEMQWMTLAQLAGTVLQPGLGAILLLAGYDIVAVAWTVAVGQLLVAGIELAATRHLGLWRAAHWEWMAALRLYRESGSFFLNSLSVVIFSRLDVLILAQLAGEAMTGIYNAAFLVIQVVNFVAIAFSHAAYPLLSNLYTQAYPQFLRLLRKMVLYGTAVTTLLAIWLVLAAHPIIGLIYGPGYEYSSRLLQLVAPFVVLFLWNALLASGLMAGDRQRHTAVVGVVKLVAGLLLYLWLTAFYGATGTALATVAAGLVGALLNALFLGRQHPELQLLRAAWKPLAIGTLLLLLIWLLNWHWLLLLAVTTGLYAGSLFLLGLFDPGDIVLLRRLLKR
jgi:O-antigen/teichoic acid export membrane protein